MHTNPGPVEWIKNPHCVVCPWKSPLARSVLFWQSAAWLQRATEALAPSWRLYLKDSNGAPQHPILVRHIQSQHPDQHLNFSLLWPKAALM